ncbi:hypothetical protein N0V94_003855 [Neodidymelliopsis sp. IMI 364377]|nr:hypothetical protein N0V94_003855 [Neodidymelliopsis sp. IMI 364377]
MSHSPLHQRLQLRSVMRQNFSAPTLSPLPPYPAGSPPKELATPSASSVSTTAAPRGGRKMMRATHVRPRTAPASPERPGTGYSTRSTIRQVEPSPPDSLKEALTNGFADGGTPAPNQEPFPAFDPKRDEGSSSESETNGTHIPSTEPTKMMRAPEGSDLRRGGTPSGRSSPQKSRSCSPRKHAPHTPSLSAHQESPSSSYSNTESDPCEPPDTPSPVPREQRSQAYAPLQIRKSFAGMNMGDDEPAASHGTHVRIADYMRKMKGARVARSLSPTKEQRKLHVLEPMARVAEPSRSHIVQAMQEQTDAGSGVNGKTSPRKEPTRHTSVSRRSETSGASVVSKHSIFSTPGRDELERKKPIVEEDEGPFAKATNMQDLEQRRRKVSETTKDESDKEMKRMCGLKCVVM